MEDKISREWLRQTYLATLAELSPAELAEEMSALDEGLPPEYSVLSASDIAEATTVMENSSWRK
jgi:hypothetical protein